MYIMHRVGKLRERQNRGYQGWRQGRMESYCLMGTVSFWDGEKVLEMIAVVVADHCECQIVHLKWLKGYILCYVYFTTTTHSD